MDIEERYKELKPIYEAANKIRKIKIISISIIILISTISISAILILYNRNLGYTFNGESESFIYRDSMLVKTNNKYYLAFGDLHIMNKEVKSIDYTTLLCNDRLIIKASRVLTGIHEEKIGYNELFPKEVYKNIDQWYLKIEYTTIDNQQKEEVIKLEAKRIGK